MTTRVLKNDTRAWRVFRFPPLSQAGAADGAAAGDAGSVQQALSEGFREGLDKGYADGFEQGREAGRREGYEDGRRQGLQRGTDEGRMQGREVFELASRPLDEMQAALRRYLDELEARRREELLELVQKVARQVIRCELTVNPAQLLTLAEEALVGMPGENGMVQILLNPEECARIRDIAPERAAAWKLVPDETLALGECRVMTEQAEADIGCQQRLDACIDALADHLKPEDEA